MAAHTLESPRGWLRSPLPGSRLVYRIALALFLTLVAIETAIFIPSYLKKEQDLLSHVELTARSALRGIASRGADHLGDEIAERHSGLVASTPIRGAIVYRPDGTVETAFGEAIELRPSVALKTARRTMSRAVGGARVDVLWTPKELRAPFMIAARLDSSEVQPALRGYAFQIVVLVTLIAAAVTLVLTIVLRKLVLTPVLATHRALLGAGEDFSRAHEWIIPDRADGELGELIGAVNQIFRHLSQSFRLIQRRNEALARLVEARIHADEQAKLAHARLVEAIEAFPGGFAVFDRDDRLVLFNANFRNYYPDQSGLIAPGVKFDELLHFGVEADRSRGDYRRDDAWIEERLRQHWSGDSDIERRMSSGRWIRITERLTQEGGVLGIFTDISELKQREEALGASEAKFRSVAESANDALIVTTVDGEVVFWNAAAERLTGYSSAEMIGTSMGRLVPSDWMAAYQSRCDMIKAGEGRDLAGKLFEGVIRSKAGEDIAIEIAFSVWSVGDRQFVTRAMRDVRERQKATEERQYLQAQLFQAQKAEALGTLAGGIAHDFNNLLTVVLGNARLLETELAPGTPGGEEVAAIMVAGERARHIIQQMLPLSPQSVDAGGAVDLRRVIGETLPRLRATLPDAVLFDEKLTCGAAVAGDATQLHRLVTNLCMNARDAIGDGPGRIVVELAESPAPDEWPAMPRDDTASPVLDAPMIQRADGDHNFLWIGFPPDGDHVRLTVSDTGRGMDAATLKRIFDPFFTTKDIGKGSGLGLATVRGIVLGHRGALYVETVPGHGSRFEVLLPRVPAADRDALAPSPGREGLRVLIIDGEPAARASMKRSLEAKGYAADEFDDAEEALRAISEMPERWGAVVAGAGPSQPSIWETAWRLHSIRPDLPVLLCTEAPEDFPAADPADESFPLRAVSNAELDSALRSCFRHDSQERT